MSIIWMRLLNSGGHYVILIIMSKNAQAEDRLAAGKAFAGVYEIVIC